MFPAKRKSALGLCGVLLMVTATTSCAGGWSEGERRRVPDSYDKAASAGFETWVLVQNPGSETVHVDLVLHTGEGELRPPGLPDRQGAEELLLRLVRHQVEHYWRVDGNGYAGFPYACRYDGTIDTSFGVVNLCNWQLLSADCLTYAWMHGGGDHLLELAGLAFRTGAELPNGEGTFPAYWSTKESVNAACFGQVWLSSRGRAR